MGNVTAISAPLHPPDMHRQAKRQATTLALMRRRGILRVVDTWRMHVADDKRRRLFEGAFDDGTAVTDGRAVMVMVMLAGEEVRLDPHQCSICGDKHSCLSSYCSKQPRVIAGSSKIQPQP